MSLLLTSIPGSTGAEENDFTTDGEQTTQVGSQPEGTEVLTERDEFSKTYVDEDGNFTKEIYVDPIHQKVDGKWEEISTDLEFNKAEGTFEPESTKLKASYPKKFASDKEITYRIGNHLLTFTNLSASDGKGEIQANLSAITKQDENKVTYENLFKGIDLRHVSLNTEVKEDWIIKEYTGINQFNYELETDLIPELKEDGSIVFYESADKEESVFVLPSPVMEDSNYNDALGNGVKSRDLHYELKKNGDGRYIINLVVDKMWLESPERVYPVYVDPSVTIDALGDTFVSSAYPDNNYNKEWDSAQGEYVLKVGKYDSTTGTNYAFIKFAIVGDLKGAIIDAAELKVYVTHSYYTTTKTGLWVDKANAYWNADKLTWNNKPSSTNITSTTVARDQWATFNVKQTVQDWVDAKYANEGFKFHVNGNGQTYWKKITAAESAKSAKITISYHYPTMKNPTVTASQYGIGKVDGYVNVKWPSIYGASSYQLQMYNGVGYQTVYSGTATSWTSKGKKIFPKSPYSTSSAYKLDGTGVELPVNPSAFYSAKSGTSTTRKEYGFRVVAVYPSGNSPASSEVKKAIPYNQIDIPDRPTVKASRYPDSDSVNKGRGWLDISWEPVDGATGYKVLILNGKNYEEFSVGNVTSWSTKGKKIWPTDSEIAAGKFALHHDKTGEELAANPNPVYLNSGGYGTFKRYSIRIKAVSDLGVTPYSDSQYGYIPLEKPANVTVTTEIVDDVKNLGAVNIKWNSVKDAGGYIVNIFNGKSYDSHDVGKVTNWSTKGISLFDDLENLPVDPTNEYKEIGTTNQTVLDKKAYLLNVQAYYHMEEKSPDTAEKEKLDGPRGLSAASSNVYATITPDDSLLGLEDYYTYGTHQMGNAEGSVNVTTGNFNVKVTDHSLFTRGELGFDFTRSYNSKSSQSSVLGKGWTFAGNEALVKKSATSLNFLYWDEDGTRHEFVFNSTSGSFTSPKGKYLTLKNATVNSKAGFTLTDKDGFIKSFEVDPEDTNKYRLQAYQDSDNNRILFRYTGNKLTEIAEVDANGTTIRNSIKLTYNSKNLLNKTSFKDRWIEYSYDDKDQLTGTTVKAAGTAKNINNSYEYDDTSGYMTVFKDGKNNTNTFSYEPNLLSILTPQANGKESIETTYEYDKSANTYQVSDTEGKTTTYKRDTVNNTFAVAEVINQDGTTSKTTYDSNYNELAETDENGRTETNQYDANGNVIKEIDKEGKVTSYQYDDKNQVLEKVDPNGVKTVNTYKGYKLETSLTGEELTKYEYDLYGRETKVIYPNDTYTLTHYDEANKKVTKTDARGNTTSTTYNDYGQVISETDGEKRTTSYTFDLLNPELKTSVTDGNGHTTAYDYDDNGNMTSLTNANGKTKTYTYDGNDQLVESVYPVSGTNTMKVLNVYDINGNLQKTQLQSGITTNYKYDNVDQLDTVTIRNKAGQDTLKWKNGYDDAGQLVNRVFDDLVTNNKLEKTFDYTANNLLENYTQGPSYSATYGYDEMSRLSNQTVKYTDSAQTFKMNQAMAYTDEGKVKSVTSGSETDTLIRMDYSYDLKQNKADVSFHNGLFKSSYTYDSSNNLTSIQYKKGTETAPGQAFTYEYDKSGNILKVTDRHGTSQYEYDGNEQLIKETLPDGTINEYRYDKVGNRLATIQNGKVTKFSYNDGNQIIAKNDTNTFTYDADGNVKKDDQFIYEYNDQGAQTKVSTLANKEVAKYEYDEEGLRTKKIVGTKTYEYYYDGEDDHLALEVMKENDQVQKYRYYQWDENGKAVGMVIQDQDSSGKWRTKTYYFWTNQRGDVTTIIDHTGAEVGSYTYDAFGNVLSETGTIAKENQIRYASYYYDQETKHYYLKARYYDPQNGNFLALDPHPGDDDDPVSQNGYTYAGNNPVSMTDPDGEYAQYIIVGVVIVYRSYKLYKGGKKVYKLVRTTKKYKIKPKKKKKKKKEREHKGTPRNNQAQNKQVDSIVSKRKLNKAQRRELHDAISHRNYSYKQIDEIAKDIKEGKW